MRFALLVLLTIGCSNGSTQATETAIRVAGHLPITQALNAAKDHDRYPAALANMQTIKTTISEACSALDQDSEITAKQVDNWIADQIGGMDDRLVASALQFAATDVRRSLAGLIPDDSLPAESQQSLRRVCLAVVDAIDFGIKAAENGTD